MFVLPTGTQPASGDALEDLLQATMVGVTGLDPTLVRPRWQPEPPNMPGFDKNWCAFGITNKRSDTYAYMKMLADGLTCQLERDQWLTTTASFYGPQADAYMELFKDGIQIPWNREALFAQGIKLIEVRDGTRLPALMKEKWVNRYDVQAVFARRINRTYAVTSILSASVGINNEYYTTQVNVP